MAHIFPFRGFRYDVGRVGSLDNVVSDPYDKIGPDLQEYYHEKDPHNIVRIIKGRTYPNDVATDNQYTRASDYLNTWIGEGVLKRDAAPCIYVYDQEYVVPGEGYTKTRKGFVALFRLLSYEEGGVKPHERTLAGPKADRLNLMRATRAQFGQIFMLYPDPEGSVNTLLDQARAARSPEIAKDRFNDSHKIWAVTDANIISNLQNLMLDKQVFIADGHHRYETALAYRDEMRGKVAPTSDFESIENRMITFVSFDDPGLLVLPTHRLVRNVKEFDPTAVMHSLKDLFELEVFPFSNSRETAQKKMLEIMHSAPESSHLVGMVLAGQNQFVLAKLKDESKLDNLITESDCEAFKRLDVVILHTLILENMLGITKEDLTEERNVEYLREVEPGVDAVQKGDAQAFFLLNPTKTWQVRDVASAGIRMPQKSTDFYPKLVTGLVLNKLSI
ncbi:MAG: DUF1015 domain-containing protein [Candidatus Coatesbacteria bacterium]|nr:DUF1015 domain-containing protein [Candidatus Coatesbacteria bacterium]